VALILLSGGCATAGVPDAPPDVEGEYKGAMLVQGQEIPGTLDVTQSNRRLSAVFEAPALGLSARGGGEVQVDGTARITLTYDLQCPGEAVMVGQFSRDGTLFQGEIVARDCTGEIPGTFSFAR
jgi:hypothetical protein